MPFSYSLYAIHVPVLLIFKSAVVVLGVSMVTLGPTALGMLVSLLAAMALFFVVEQWSLKVPDPVAEREARTNGDSIAH